MKSFKQFLAITGLLLGIIACKDTSSDIIPSDSTTQTIPATNLDKLDPIQLEKVSKLVADVMQDPTVLTEVKNIIDKKLELHDDEFVSLLPYMGEDKNHSSFTTPLLYDKMKDLLTKTSDEQTKLFAILNPLEIYWIYSKVWDGKTTPTVCYATEDAELEQTVTNMTGFVKQGNTYLQVKVDEMYMLQHSVIVIRRLQPTNIAEQNLQNETLKNTRIESGNGGSAVGIRVIIDGYDIYSEWEKDNEKSNGSLPVMTGGYEFNSAGFHLPFNRLVLRRSFWYSSFGTSGAFSISRAWNINRVKYIWFSQSRSLSVYETAYNDEWWNNKSKKLYQVGIDICSNLLQGTSQRFTITNMPGKSMGSAWTPWLKNGENSGDVYLNGIIRTYGGSNPKIKINYILENNVQSTVDNAKNFTDVYSCSKNMVYNFKTCNDIKFPMGMGYFTFLDKNKNYYIKYITTAYATYEEKTGTLGTIMDEKLSFDDIYNKWGTNHEKTYKGMKLIARW